MGGIGLGLLLFAGTIVSGEPVNPDPRALLEAVKRARAGTVSGTVCYSTTTTTVVRYVAMLPPGTPRAGSQQLLTADPVQAVPEQDVYVGPPRTLSFDNEAATWRWEEAPLDFAAGWPGARLSHHLEQNDAPAQDLYYLLAGDGADGSFEDYLRGHEADSWLARLDSVDATVTTGPPEAPDGTLVLRLAERAKGQARTELWLDTARGGLITARGDFDWQGRLLARTWIEYRREQGLWYPCRAVTDQPASGAPTASGPGGAPRVSQVSTAYLPGPLTGPYAPRTIYPAPPDRSATHPWPDDPSIPLLRTASTAVRLLRLNQRPDAERLAQPGVYGHAIVHDTRVKPGVHYRQPDSAPDGRSNTDHFPTLQPVLSLEQVQQLAKQSGLVADSANELLGWEQARAAARRGPVKQRTGQHYGFVMLLLLLAGAGPAWLAVRRRRR